MRRGFTLLELLMVVIIIGILISVGVPQYFRAVERGRASEAYNLLGAIRGAQIRYKAEHGAYYTSDNKLDSFDIQVTTPKYFSVQTPDSTDIGQVKRKNEDLNSSFGQYTLKIDESGTITCTDAEGKSGCKAIGR